MSISTQNQFANALRDEAQAVPQGLTSWNLPRPERRFDVYRNNVAVGLSGAIASRFPVAQQIVGDAFFTGMARIFVADFPPKSPLLLNYGDDFGDFVETFEPAAELPYLADVIRLEAARGRAYHAADHAPLDPAVLAIVPPEELAEVIFEPHPSLGLVRSAHPVVTIWAMNAGEMPLVPINDWVAEDALVVRPAMTVNVQTLPPGGAVFIDTLRNGLNLGTAFEMAMTEAETFDLSANLAGILQAGAFTKIR
ncbi:DNA-binding domain-containing protein [Agrobacterium sp. rho-13.3]|uniref:HvfC/BufC N-terminal domain-containing protein n=1 Tax=Agrobacterium sp. rho-13.3 TaxID=3072980 RepID=UPI002A10A98D|nr:DNA-binding domain-containing protein [Agrobacterium sp. rho-13.3]MDX8308409.1 DNA-binding domain-containing protein [Agrobacterium sp. rho-13.3]